MNFDFVVENYVTATSKYFVSSQIFILKWSEVLLKKDILLESWYDKENHSEFKTYSEIAGHAWIDRWFTFFPRKLNFA